MAYGLNFNNTSGAKVIDGKHLIPQKVISYDMASRRYVDYTEAQSGCQPGYILRQYDFVEPPGGYQRPLIYFWEMPEYAGRDVWLMGATTGCTVLYANNLAASSVPHPRVHVFALDYITQSNASTGMRVWNPDNNQLIYDSGNQHLGIYEIFAVSVDTVLNTDLPRGNISSFTSPHNYFPWDTNGQAAGISGPAFTTPNRQTYVNYRIRFGNEYEWRAATFYRCFGATLQTRLMRTQFLDLGENPSTGGSTRYISNPGGNNLSTQNIFGANYR